MLQHDLDFLVGMGYSELILVKLIYLSQTFSITCLCAVGEGNDKKGVVEVGREGTVGIVSSV